MFRWGNTCIRDIVEKFCPKGEEEVFAEWAFGKDYKQMGLSEMLDSWNKLHGDLMRFDHTGRVVNDVETMVEVWMRYGRENKKEPKDSDKVHAMIHALLPTLNLHAKHIGFAAMLQICVCEGVRSYSKDDFMRLIETVWDDFEEKLDEKNCCGKCGN